MNHLAHLMLVRNSDELMLGGFIADAVKGKKFLDYEKEISKGILLHRFIDNYTDTHAEVSELKKLLRPQFGLLSGVVIDMIYDHFWQSIGTNSILIRSNHFRMVHTSYLKNMFQ